MGQEDQWVPLARTKQAVSVHPKTMPGAGVFPLRCQEPGSSFSWVQISLILPGMRGSGTRGPAHAVPIAVQPGPRVPGDAASAMAHTKYSPQPAVPKSLSYYVLSPKPCEPPACKAEAEAMEKELLEDYRFGRQQLIEIWGHACAMAVTKAFPRPSLPRKQPTVLVVCGPAQNGAIGLVCARHLRIFDYEPTIFYPKRSPDPLYRDFTTQCEKMDIPFLSYLPTE
ncbi:PREDICTED: yjeF N-terminal domain-containing protein 3-like, partial [Mesitornis unicolor]|uniref:yjeF N-terminal domain-containing protein 3-like n=1 Tax=Mesitornis unicolor TaxID=54374 RepID=UPI000528E9F5